MRTYRMTETRPTAVTTAALPAVVQRSRGRKAPPCPHCGQPGGLCDEHRQRLQQIRDDMSDRKGQHNYHNTVSARGYRAPSCCTPDCLNPRSRGAQFCEHCMEQAG